jgi:hypothetical protein
MLRFLSRRRRCPRRDFNERLALEVKTVSWARKKWSNFY